MIAFLFSGQALSLLYATRASLTHAVTQDTHSAYVIVVPCSIASHVTVCEGHACRWLGNIRTRRGAVGEGGRRRRFGPARACCGDHFLLFGVQLAGYALRDRRDAEESMLNFGCKLLCAFKLSRDIVRQSEGVNDETKCPRVCVRLRSFVCVWCR